MTTVDERTRLQHLADLEVEAVVELGRKSVPLAEARRWRPGDVIALDKLAGAAMDVLINGVPFAEGESVVVGKRMACRLTRMRPLAGMDLEAGADRRASDG